MSTSVTDPFVQQGDGSGVEHLPPEQWKALRPFVRDGRVVKIPSKQAPRRFLLDWLAQEFEPGVTYSESEVNDVLARRHPDVAALRRYLVDDDFMTREAGRYWRSGGSTDV